MVSKSEYGTREVEAAKNVLVELMQILGEYREQMVLIGGWVPFFLFGSGHVGSTDIDLALDKDEIAADVYHTIRENLEKHGYQEGTQKFQFIKSVTIDSGDPIDVQVDFLAGEYGGTGKGHRHQKVQDITPRKARGCELALAYHTRISVSGRMPNGALNTVDVQLSDVVPFIVMKGMALYDRMKEKDAWDIYYCVKAYANGPEALVQKFREVLTHGLVQEGLSKIRSKWLSIDHMGPVHVVTFEELSDREERARLQRDAFERVTALLDQLDIRGYVEGT